VLWNGHRIYFIEYPGEFVSIWYDPIGLLELTLTSLFLSWGFSAEIARIVIYLLGGFTLATGAMIFVTVLIWLERKLIGRIQDRLGPNRVGPFGIFQSIADLVKIFTKEYITPVGADWIPFNLAPVLSVAGVLMIWAVMPLGLTFLGVNLNMGVLFVIAAGAIGEIGVVLAGWGSNNKFALLGAFRAIGQLISYEVPMLITLMIPVMFSGSLGLNDIVKAQSTWFIVLAPVAGFIFFITQVAEVGRSPFDLVEADSEIVAGFNIEYSGLKFGMFYVAEFLHAFTAAALFAVFFLGGWQGPWAEKYPLLGVFYTSIKTSLVYFVIILMRGGLPRFRMDQMMDVNWKLLTPLALAVVIVTALVDKLTAGGSSVAHIGALWLANVVLIIFTLRYLRSYAQRKRRPLVVPSASGVLPESNGEAIL
jgi:NADH-quinone oxidoreductase subunit H